MEHFTPCLIVHPGNTDCSSPISLRGTQRPRQFLGGSVRIRQADPSSLFSLPGPPHTLNPRAQDLVGSLGHQQHKEPQQPCPGAHRVSAWRWHTSPFLGGDSHHTASPISLPGESKADHYNGRSCSFFHRERRQHPCHSCITCLWRGAADSPPQPMVCV